MVLLALWSCWLSGLVGSLALLTLWRCWLYGVVGSMALLAPGLVGSLALLPGIGVRREGGAEGGGQYNTAL
jgi:hypothetical protein